MPKTTYSPVPKLRQALALQLQDLSLSLLTGMWILSLCSCILTELLSKLPLTKRTRAKALLRNIDVELKRYTDDAAEVTKKTGANSIEDLQNDTGASAQHLKAAITLLPELRERKALLDMHMNILSALLKGIKDRQLDNYFQLEEDIKKQTKAQMLELLNDSDKGKEPLDKLRLFIIWFLSTEQDVSRAEMERFEEALKKTGVDTFPVTYIRKVREITRMTMISSAPQQPSQQSSASNDLFRGFTSISSRLTDRFKEAGIGANFDNLISGVKNFLPANKDLTLTKITESLMDPQNASTSALQKTEGFLYFDPRSANARGTMPPSAKDARNARGSYGNLQDWAKRTSGGGSGGGAGGSGAAGAVGKKRVIYGSTELVNAGSFLKELARLGSEATTDVDLVQSAVYCIVPLSTLGCFVILSGYFREADSDIVGGHRWRGEVASESASHLSTPPHSLPPFHRPLQLRNTQKAFRFNALSLFEASRRLSLSSTSFAPTSA
ncbi:Sec1 family protein [Hortaea werneckii]|nr:Sec1 family protein [Hortaea werneckii]